MITPTFVILAGGIGKRFQPLTISKTLLPLLGKPVIDYTLEMIARVGGKKVIITTNQHNQTYLENYSHPDLELTLIKQSEPLGMGAALLLTKNDVGSDPIIVMNATDFVADSLLKNFLLKIQNLESAVTGIKVQKYFPGGYLQVEGEKVVSIVEKPGPGNEPSDLVNLVFHYFKNPQEFFELIEAESNQTDDQYERALAKLMKKQSVSFVEYDGYWQALKYSHMILDVMEIFLKHHLKSFIHPSAQIADSAIIGDQVYIDEGARVFEGAVIKGPTYIGRHAIVGNNSLIRESTIEEGAKTGFGSEIARSYIGPNCALHHNFIGDSILESNVNPSYGTCTANLRLDEQNVEVKYASGQVDSGRQKFGCIIAHGVFCGINCALMPGITIGARSKIFPNLTLFESVGENQIFRGDRS